MHTQSKMHYDIDGEKTKHFYKCHPALKVVNVQIVSHKKAYKIYTVMLLVQSTIHLQKLERVDAML